MINREDLLSGTRPEVHDRVLITVMDHFEGYQVMDYKGMVWGISIRVKDMGQDFLMGCKQITGGELSSFTELSDESRQRAVDRMVGMAKRIGANAIINFKFEQRLGDASGGAEVTAFGNAVLIKPIVNYVPTGGLGNILAEFVDIFADKHGVQKPSFSATHSQEVKQPIQSQEAPPPPPSDSLMIGKLAKDSNSQLYVLCPNCQARYGAEVTSNMQIKIKNFDDENADEAGQQITCIKCGQMFTVPNRV